MERRATVGVIPKEKIQYPLAPLLFAMIPTNLTFNIRLVGIMVFLSATRLFKSPLKHKTPQSINISELAESVAA